MYFQYDLLILTFYSIMNFKKGDYMSNKKLKNININYESDYNYSKINNLLSCNNLNKKIKKDNLMKSNLGISYGDALNIINNEVKQIKEAYYNNINNILTLKFKKGTYVYKDVPQELIKELQTSEDPTETFNEKIRNRYETQKL